MKECDLVMKGGIASGVVYPKAVSVLSQNYRFKNIGGTSAGAIAAALAAAAEYQRQANPDNHDGFQLLDQELPDAIGTDLLKLFQPHKTHKKLFKAAIKYLDKKSKSPFWFIAKNFFKIRRSIKALPKTDYGFCSGMTMPKNNIDGLTEWLDRWIEKCAGRISSNITLPTKPLTFGMLKEKGVTLRMMTTNISQQQAVVLPFKSKYFALKKDINRLLPKNVAAYLIEHSIQQDDKKVPRNSDYIMLPTVDDMPVIMAVRMSLSFPILLTAFPLQQQDWSLWRCNDEQRKFRPCWFSDGGISSNFPIHLFDSVFPSRPTFGISLSEYDQCRQHPDEDQSDGKPGENRIYLPINAGGGLAVPIYPITKIGQFIFSIFNTAQNWQDKAQTKLPGYRDRITTVSLKDSEGGLNLTMSREKVDNLVHLGKLAADEINNKFKFDIHRLRRLLSSYAAIENGLIEILHQFKSQTVPEDMQDFLIRYRQDFTDDNLKQGNYKPNNVDEIDELIQNVELLIGIGEQLNQHKPLSQKWGNEGMPKPTTVLRLVPSSIYDNK